MIAPTPLASILILSLDALELAFLAFIAATVVSVLQSDGRKIERDRESSDHATGAYFARLDREFSAGPGV